MVTVGFYDAQYEMIVDLIDRHMEDMINRPMDDIVVDVVNEWIGILHTFGEHDLAEEYESVLDDIQEVA